MKTQVVALVLNPGEIALVLRAVGELVEREGPSPTALAVMEMLDGALPPNAMDGFEEWIA